MKTSYLLGPDFEAVIGPVEPVEVVKKLLSPQKKKVDGHLPYKTAGSAAVKRRRKGNEMYAQHSECDTWVEEKS